MLDILYLPPQYGRVPLFFFRVVMPELVGLYLRDFSVFLDATSVFTHEVMFVLFPVVSSRHHLVCGRTFACVMCVVTLKT